MESGSSKVALSLGGRSLVVSKSLIDAALWMLLALNTALMVYYICRGYRSDFHSDSAIKNLLAQEMVEVGSYFPPDWNYVNGDLWIVFGQAFVLPFLPWAQNGFALHAISGLISAGLILYGVWLVMSLLVESQWVRRIALITFAGAFSALGAENLYGQVSYGSVLYMACFTLYLSWRFLEAPSRKAIRWALGLLVLLVLAFWSNPQRAVAYDLLPIFAAVAARLIGRFQATASTEGKRDMMRCAALLAIWVVATGIGVLLHARTLAHATSIEGASSAHWLPFDLMVRNFWMSIEGLLAILGGIPTAGIKVMALSGLPDGVRMIVALAALTMIPIAMAAAFRSARPARRFIAVYSAASLALFFFLQVTTTTPDMTDPVTSARYMLPALMFGVMLLIATLGSIEHGWRFRGVAGIVIAVLALGAAVPPNPLSRAIFGNPPDDRVGLMAFLEEQGLEYGYATYWNAGANTVLSRGRVKVRQILPKDGMVVPYRHLSSNRWYLPEAWSGRTFLMLTNEEKRALDWSKVTAYAGEPERELHYGKFRIYVFPKNLASTLPLWDNDVVVDLVGLQPAHSIGRQEILDGSQVLIAEQGEQGFLHYGPYLSLDDGRYRVEAAVEFDAADAGLIDVTASRGRKTLASRRLTGSAGLHEFRLEFDVPRGVTDLEVRLQSSGASKMIVRRLTLVRVAAADLANTTGAVKERATPVTSGS